MSTLKVSFADMADVWWKQQHPDKEPKPKRRKTLEELEVHVGKDAPWWWGQLKRVIPELEATEECFFDRRSIQVLFRVEETTAWRIIRNFGGEKICGRWLINKDTLLNVCRKVQAQPNFRGEMDRRDERWKKIEALRRQGPLVTVRSSPSPDSFPEGITVGHGRVVITVANAECAVVALQQLGLFLIQEGGWEKFRREFEGTLPMISVFDIISS